MLHHVTTSLLRTFRCVQAKSIKCIKDGWRVSTSSGQVKIFWVRVLASCTSDVIWRQNLCSSDQAQLSIVTWNPTNQNQVRKIDTVIWSIHNVKILIRRITNESLILTSLIWITTDIITWREQVLHHVTCHIAACRHVSVTVTDKRGNTNKRLTVWLHLTSAAMCEVLWV